MQPNTLRVATAGAGGEDNAFFVLYLEKQMVSDRDWAGKPKPKVEVPTPQDIPNPPDLIGRTRLLLDVTHLALKTDSTRLITIMLAGSTAAPPIQGVSLGHHDLSHHGKDPGKLAQLKIRDRRHENRARSPHQTPPVKGR
jgi:hypothetical protein